MADASTKEAMTNTTPKSRVEVNCDCDTMWSFAQEFSTKRLSTMTGEHKGDLVRDYAVRARRIAATYARFYLETEDGGDPAKIGRYYWMALGAFASKTVACTFDAWQVKAMTTVTKTVWEGLGKGNFWLFCDISGWHWYRNNYPGSFDMCMEKRDSRNYVKDVKLHMKSLPWEDKALSTIKNMRVTSQIKLGFRKVSEFEAATQIAVRQKSQLDHLLAIADHEQGNILQPLIYDDADFANWVQMQRAPYASWASPALELVFAHECRTPDDKLRSIAPEKTTLENLQSRMLWITSAAKVFHQLMITQTDAMTAELKKIASWSDLPDKASFEESVKKIGKHALSELEAVSYNIFDY